MVEVSAPTVQAVDYDVVVPVAELKQEKDF